MLGVRHQAEDVPCLVADARNVCDGTVRVLARGVAQDDLVVPVELEVDAPDEAEARTQLERMCEQLLANPLIESYEIEFRGQG